MNNSTTYCVLADIGIATLNSGHTAICNLSKVPFRDENDVTLTLDQHTLEQAWASPVRQEIVAALKSGVKHSNCTDCWDEEAAGRFSTRLRSNQQFKHVVPMDQPRAFYLKPGNTCNLACRHCHPDTSSGWYRDYFQVESQEQSYPIFLQRFSSTQDSYRDENPVWNTLLKWSDHAVFYDLYGAEPLLIKPLWETLEAASLQPTARDTDIHISTNGTMWKDQYYEVFARFKSVSLGISVDGLYNQFNYMRYPAEWSEVSENIIKYKELSNRVPSIQIAIETTLSLLNVYYMNDIWHYFDNLGIWCGFNILHRPRHLNLRIMPDQIKSDVIAHLESNPVRETANIVKLIQLPIENQPESFQRFREVTESYDQLRNQSYASAFPEMHALLSKCQ